MSVSHLELVKDILEKLNKLGAKDHIPLVLGGIIPKEDIKDLEKLGIKAIFGPSDYELTKVIAKVMDVVEEKEKAIAKAN